MKNKTLLAVFLKCLAMGSIAQADGILSEPVTKWHPVIGLGGGASSTINLGQSQTFPIIDPVTDEAYIYSAQNRIQTQGLFEVFAGAEHRMYSNWLLQAGLAYTQAGSFMENGTLVQGADALSADVYTYQYKAVTRELMAQAKLMRPYHDKVYPYLLVGLGSSFNSTSDFSTSAPSFLTFTRNYADKTSSSFVYRVGLGVDLDVAPHIRLGLAYRFSDLGGINFGQSSIDQINVNGTLSQSNVYANEVLLQLSYVV